jgi:hypothetical protein
MKPTHAEMIATVTSSLNEPFTTKQIIKAIVDDYSKIRPINEDSLRTDIAGCCVNLKSYKHLPDLPNLLVSISRGRYRRFNPAEDSRLTV